MFNMEKFSSLLSAKRKERGLTQAQLADLVGVTHQAISKWERAEAMPEISKIGDIAKALNVPADELINTLYEGETPRAEQSEAQMQACSDDAYFALDDKTRVGDIYALAPKLSKETLHLAIDTLIAAKGASAASMLFRFADREYLSKLGATLFAQGDTMLAEYVDENVLQGAVVELMSKAQAAPDIEKAGYYQPAGQLLTCCRDIEFINTMFDFMMSYYGTWNIWQGIIGKLPSEVIVHQGVKIATRLGPNCFYSWWDIIGRRNIAKILIGYAESYEKNNFRAWGDIGLVYGYADSSIMEKYIKERLADSETNPKIFRPIVKYVDSELRKMLADKGVYPQEKHQRDFSETPMGVLFGNLRNNGSYGVVLQKLEELIDIVSELNDRIDDLESRIDDLESRIDDLESRIDDLE